MIAGLLLCAAVSLAAPQGAYAAITIGSLDNLPFETAAQKAGHITWNSNSKVTTSGSARVAKYNTYSKTTAYDFVNKNDSITLQNVGTDASGNAYDLKITMTACSGYTLNHYYSEGWHDSLAYGCSNTRMQLCLAGPSDSTSALQTGKRISMVVMNQSSGDCTLRFQYLKHGTTTAASAGLFCQIYDLDYDNYKLNTFADSDLDKYSEFKGLEGIKTQDADLYLPSNTKLSKDATSGKVWIPSKNAGNVGKVWTNGVALASKGSSTSVTFAAYDNLDLYLDYQASPGSPSKSATISG